MLYYRQDGSVNPVNKNLSEIIKLPEFSHYPPLTYHSDCYLMWWLGSIIFHVGSYIIQLLVYWGGLTGCFCYDVI